MTYPQISYLFVFLPAVLILYQLFPRKFRWLILLGFSYLFFILAGHSYGKFLISYLLATTVFTWLMGKWIRHLQTDCGKKEEELQGDQKKKVRTEYQRKEKWILTVGILGVFGVLGVLKYGNFFAGNIDHILRSLGKTGTFPVLDLLVPVGISYYTLEAAGYLADVYWKRVKEDQPLGKVALFLGFFPQTIEGPIAIYSDTADQLWKGDPIRLENLQRGSIRIFWGLFKKLVIAVRLNTVTAVMFDNYRQYSGMMTVMAAVACTVQLYMDFSGEMDMIIGSAELFGIRLPENFRQPFASRSAAEFWRRWHITLGVWLRTYVFYPVSVSGLVKKWNRYARKKFGKYVAVLGVSALSLFPVWLFNGLWHGPKWQYIFYGMYYFVILMAEISLAPAREYVFKKHGISNDVFWWRTIQILKTWIVIFLGEMFFRADSLQAGFSMFRSMFRNFHLSDLWNGALLGVGIDAADLAAVVAGCIVVGIVGHIRERRPDVRGSILQAKLIPRWGICLALILAVAVFGAYGTGYTGGNMAYAGF